MMMMMMAGGCGGAGFVFGGGDGGVIRRVEESDMGDRIDRVVRNIFGVGRKSHRKTFPVTGGGGGGVPVAGYLCRHMRISIPRSLRQSEFEKGVGFPKTDGFGIR
ncbi:hypothetical protein Tco_0417522 [Tanacetum coccineum]